MKILLPIVGTAFLASRSVQANGLTRRLRELEHSFTAPIKQTEQNLNWKQVQGERDMQAICSMVLDEFTAEIAAVYPYEFSCDCNYRLRQGVTLTCATKVCISDIAEIITVGDNIVPPLAENACFDASYKGSLLPIGMQLTSTLCTETSGMTVDLEGFESRLGGVDLFQQELVSFDIPQVCATLHHRPNEFDAFESCSVTVEGQDCPCEVCDEAGQSIQLECPDLMESFLPEMLRSYFPYTTECVGVSMIGDVFDESEVVAVVAPTALPSDRPSSIPTLAPVAPTSSPSDQPSTVPTLAPVAPTASPSDQPSTVPTEDLAFAAAVETEPVVEDITVGLDLGEIKNIYMAHAAKINMEPADQSWSDVLLKFNIPEDDKDKPGV